MAQDTIIKRVWRSGSSKHLTPYERGWYITTRGLVDFLLVLLAIVFIMRLREPTPVHWTLDSIAKVVCFVANPFLIRWANRLALKRRGDFCSLTDVARLAVLPMAVMVVAAVAFSQYDGPWVDSVGQKLALATMQALMWATTGALLIKCADAQWNRLRSSSAASPDPTSNPAA